MREKYKDSPPWLREELIEREAQCMETVNFKRPFSPGELTIIREEHSKLCLKIDELDIQLKSLSSPLKEEIKIQKGLAHESLTKLKTECEVSDIKIYGFPNHEDNIMEYYTIQGDFHSDRKLLVAEKQLRIEDELDKKSKKKAKKNEE